MYRIKVWAQNKQRGYMLNVRVQDKKEGYMIMIEGKGIAQGAQVKNGGAMPLAVPFPLSIERRGLSIHRATELIVIVLSH